MTDRSEQDPRPGRPALSRERVVQGAVEVADARGIAALTIRSLAQHLGVKPMSPSTPKIPPAVTATLPPKVVRD